MFSTTLVVSYLLGQSHDTGRQQHTHPPQQSCPTMRPMSFHSSHGVNRVAQWSILQLPAGSVLPVVLRWADAARACCGPPPTCKNSRKSKMHHGITTAAGVHTYQASYKHGKLLE